MKRVTIQTFVALQILRFHIFRIMYLKNKCIIVIIVKKY